MANITLGQLRDLWKNVSDWVTGVAAHEPKVQLSGSIAENLATRMVETISGSRSGPLAAETIEDLVAISRPCDLESLSIGSNSASVRLLVAARRADGTLSSGMRLVRADGSTTDLCTPQRLHDLGGENDYWREFVYNEQSGQYAFGMKRQSRFGAGVTIRVQNASTNEIQAAVTWMLTTFA